MYVCVCVCVCACVCVCVCVCVLIATYFLLKLNIEDIEINPGPSYFRAYGIKKAVQGTFHQENT